MSKRQRVEFGWFIPTTGDGPRIGVKPERAPTLDYFVQVAQTAEQAGFEFTLIPTGGACIDSWIVGSMIAAQTTKLKPLVAMRPGLIAPVLAARMAASLDYLSGGRALINVVSGGSPDDLKATGDPLYENHDDRYERTLEFLDIVKQVWTESHNLDIGALIRGESGTGGQPVRYHGKYFDVDGGVSRPAPVQTPHPPLYFGGSSPAGKRTAAEMADVYLMWAEPIEWIRGQIAEMEQIREELFRKKSIRRELRYGLRAQLVVRETEEEAWKAAWNIIGEADPALVSLSDRLHSRTDATNQRRQIELWKASEKDGYVIGPNLWAGLSRIRGGGAVAFVGTPEQVSDRLVEFVEAGISSFVLSGYPHVEEAQIAGRHLLPLVKRKLAERNVQFV